MPRHRQALYVGGHLKKTLQFNHKRKVTKFSLSLILFVGQFGFGQSADSINKIVFAYGRSHNSWGNPGIYGRGEVIELIRTATNDFRISRYYTTTASAGDDGKSYSQDTIELNINKYQTVLKEKIQFWLTQLNTSKENFTESFIKSKLSKPTKNEILTAARKYNQLWMLTGEGEDYFDKEDKADARSAIRKMKSLVGLDSFLIYKRPTIEDDLVVTDSYHGLRILTIQSNGDTTEYRCQFFEPLGQPITRFAKRNYMDRAKFFNLEANTSALSFLPRNSMTGKALSLDNIKEQYIKWYLDRF